MGPLTFVCLSVFGTVLLTSGTNAGDCPAVSKVYSCSPKCVQNYDCSNGRVCCENQCHTKSCVEKAAYGGGNDDKYNKQSGGGGIYCNNIKCNSFEVCKLDSVTKRMKCVRS